MSNRVVVQEGYELPFAEFDGYRRRRRHKRRAMGSYRRKRRGGGSHRRKFAMAAKACGGHGFTRRQFADCMKRKLRK